MSPSRPCCIGMDVHKDAIALAYVAQDHGAEGTSLGTIGTRQCDLEPLSRKMPSKATPLIVVYDAGLCGDWLYRYLTTKGDACWVVAPATTHLEASGLPVCLQGRIVRAGVAFDLYVADNRDSRQPVAPTTDFLATSILTLRIERGAVLPGFAVSAVNPPLRFLRPRGCRHPGCTGFGRQHCC